MEEENKQKIKKCCPLTHCADDCQTNCAWWDSWEEKCAVMLIAKHLEGR